MLLNEKFGANHAKFLPRRQLLRQQKIGFRLSGFDSCPECQRFHLRYSTSYPGAPPSDSKVPFEDLLAPFAWNCLEEITKRLTTSAARPLFWQSSAWKSAQTGLMDGIVKSLYELSWRCLYVEFDEFRRKTGTFGAYQGFHEIQTTSDGKAIFDKYPVLARLLETVCQQAIRNITLFLQRLEHDFHSPPATISASLSDRHHGGQTVFGVTLESGERWVYKPRDLRCEAGFAKLQTFFNLRMRRQPFPVQRVLLKDGYGWAEFVAHRPCAPENLADFYHNAGSLLGLLYLLGATDCHLENIRAHGVHPIFIDAESLFTPSLRASAAMPEQAFDPEESILRTGMLPRWIFQKRGAETLATDFSALGAQAASPGFIKEPKWSATNQDEMDFRLEFHERQHGEHLPAKSARAYEYRDAICEGVRDLLTTASNCRDALLTDADSPLRALEKSFVRYIHRPTLAYRMIFERSLDPVSLRSGTHWAVQLDLLSQAYLKSNHDRADGLEFYAHEFSSMLDLDVPYFSLKADSRTLKSFRGKPLVHFQESGYEAASRRLRDLDARQVDIQTAIVKETLISTLSSPRAKSRSLHRYAGHPDQCTDVECLEAALLLGRRLQSAPLRNHATWLGLAYHHGARRFQFSDIGPWLYGGTSGVALFFAALSRAANEKPFAGEAVDILEIAFRRLRRMRFGIGSQTSAGALEGMPSFLLALHMVHSMVPSAGLENMSQEIIAATTPDDFLSSPKTLDFVAGQSGALAVASSLAFTGLLPLDYVTQIRSKMLPALENEISQARVRPGISHGLSAGIFALAKAQSLVTDPDAAETLSRLIDAENGYFDAPAGTWPDLRHAPARFSAGWCNGALGILYARKAAEPHVAGAGEDCRRAIRYLEKSVPDAEPTLCCGTAGHFMASQNGLSSLSDPFRQLAADLTVSIREGRSLRLVPSIADDVRIPSLFLGESGIGLAFLRLARPSTLPDLFAF